MNAGETPQSTLARRIAIWAIKGLVFKLFVANAFFSLVVRIQSERGHQVASGGPYRLIRHPGYVGAMLFTVAAPLMLGSWWGLIPGSLGAVLYVVRTALEDKTPQDELEGYREYTQTVKYRLLPGIW